MYYVNVLFELSSEKIRMWFGVLCWVEISQREFPLFMVYGFGGGIGEPNRGGCKGGCRFEKSLDVCVNLEWKI